MGQNVEKWNLEYGMLIFEWTVLGILRVDCGENLLHVWATNGWATVL